jgi:hypothetical protein
VSGRPAGPCWSRQEGFAVPSASATRRRGPSFDRGTGAVIAKTANSTGRTVKPRGTHRTATRRRVSRTGLRASVGRVKTAWVCSSDDTR